MMSKFKITEVSFSYNEESSFPQTMDEKTSEIKCYIVAHAIYEYAGESGAVDSQVYLVATKNYDSDGNVTVTKGPGEFPTSEKILESLKSIIETKIKSDNMNKYYRGLVESSLSKALTLKGLPTRNSPTMCELNQEYPSLVD